MLSTTTPLRDGRRDTVSSPFGEAASLAPCSDPPRGEAGVVGVAQQLARVPHRHQPVSDQLEAQTLIVGRLVHCRRTEIWSGPVWSGPAAAPDLGGSLRTRHGVVHVEAVAFDVFQGHAPVHKHTEKRRGLSF